MFCIIITVTFFKLFPQARAMAWVLLSLVLLSTPSLYAQELPPVEVVEDSVPIEEPPAVTQKCQAIIINKDIEDRYQKIQEGLEADYAQGMPKQLRTDLIRVRKDIDSLTAKLFDLDQNNSQEINHIAQLTIDYLEKMISLVPKANRIAPQVRDRFVVPFTNISSIRAEYQDCMMEAAVAEAKSQDTPVQDLGESINIYKQLTKEMERLNSNLYTLQTTDVQRYVSYRNKILRRLEAFNKNDAEAVAVTNEIPQILNKVQMEIETLIPGLELSKEYLTVAH